MYLEEVAQWLQTLPITFSSYVIGEHIKTESDALGIYILRQDEQKPKRAIGTMTHTTYAISSIRLLIQGIKSAGNTQRKAVDFYRLLEQQPPKRIGDHPISSMELLTQEPQPLAQEVNGTIYEITFSLTYER